MAYRHHPQAAPPAGGIDSGARPPVARLAVGALALAGLAGGAWLLLRSRIEATPLVVAARMEGERAPTGPTALVEAPGVSGQRQAAIVRGALAVRDPSVHRLTVEDLAGLSREQLGSVRQAILARSIRESEPDRTAEAVSASSGLSAVEAANLRLVEEAAKSR